MNPDARVGYQDDAQRLTWHCGWMDREDWAPWPEEKANRPIPPRWGSTEYELDVCPGYVVRLPLVAECAQAWRAYDKGQLEEYAPDAEHAVWEGVLVLANSIDAYSAAEMKKAANK